MIPTPTQPGVAQPSSGSLTTGSTTPTPLLNPNEAQ